MLLRQALRCRPLLRCVRPLSASTVRPATVASTAPTMRPDSDPLPPTEPPFVSVAPDRVLYRGPLASTFKRLKIFSLSSFSLCLATAPLMFAIETQLPMSARALLAATAVGTSGISTALIAWAGRSYVTALRITKAPSNDGVEQLELTTLTLRLRPRITRVFDPAFMVPTKRPFAKWELAQLVLLPPHLRNKAPGEEETVAETTDERGHVLGRWVVKWGEGGEGSCYEVGTVVRHFNVHDELLPPVSELASEVPPEVPQPTKFEKCTN
ncbi:hypothetical protein B0H15DRAFT_884964 [Mycena belliarum]|uniref:Uncharacterized protein n=1 Tax=Mycena belliarum TaxID=1033014 RepID=A0AAD6U9E5_9AGAR|nr:hypothetical protein B0H15DRAFT_884964 [Mycena belliae]